MPATRLIAGMSRFQSSKMPPTRWEAVSLDGHAGHSAPSAALASIRRRTWVAGEGGALVVHDESATQRARIFREKGTNRDDFMAGRVPFYSWVGLGSSLVMPEISAAIARVQFDKLSEILSTRRKIAELYDSGLAVLEREGSLRVVRPVLDAGASSHHIYAVLVAPDRRASIIRKMAQAGVQVSSHFVPLHKSPYGRHVTKSPDLPITDRVAASVVRLPDLPGPHEERRGKSRRCAHEGLERLTMPPTAVGMDLSVVLPVFKNRSQLPELYGRLTGVLSLAMPQYELVFVDDAGGDGSLEWLRGRVGSDPRVRLVEMGVNRGQHVAVVEGMAAATGSVVVVMDAIYRMRRKKSLDCSTRCATKMR